MRLPKIELVTDWKTALKMWSIRLGAFASAVIGFVIADPGTFATILFNVVGFLPFELRLVVAVVVAVIVFAVIGITRLTKQEKLSAPKSEPPAAP